MKKIIFLSLAITTIFAIPKEELIGEYICKAQYVYLHLLGKMITNITREINISKNTITIKEDINMSTCPKKFLIIGSYKCVPSYKGTVYMKGKYHLKGNKLIFKTNERKTTIKDDLKYKQKIEHEYGFDKCNKMKKFSKYCYKSKNSFEKRWRRKHNILENYKQNDIIFKYIENNQFLFHDNFWDIEFECNIKE